MNRLPYKHSKRAVDYSKGMPQSHCGICVNFLPPHGCKKVAGRIDAGYWCKLFEKKVEK